MSRTGEVLDWIEAGRVVSGSEHEALRAAGIAPTRGDWHAFLGRLTLWLGTVAIAAALIFFFAFNWDELGRFAKFGLLEGAILAGLALCLWLDLDSAAGKAVLLLLSLLVGALLALAGQTYQTGADTYELFAWWALLILPWVLVGRLSPLWLVWLVLLNAALFLYFSRSSAGEGLLWALFALNLAALVAWEAAHAYGLAWLRDGWPPRLVAVAAGTAATALMMMAIFDDGHVLGALAWLAWLAAAYAWYRHARPDLFMLAGGLLSLIVVVAAFLTRHVFASGAGGALLIGLVVIGLSAGGAIWLKSINRELAA